MTKSYLESVVEDATLDWFVELGYTVAHGPDPTRGLEDVQTSEVFID